MNLIESVLIAGNLFSVALLALAIKSVIKNKGIHNSNIEEIKQNYLTLLKS